MITNTNVVLNLVTFYSSIASSAPILQMDTPCDAVAKIITQDFTWSSPECANTIKTSWAAIDDVASQGTFSES